MGTHNTLSKVIHNPLNMITIKDIHKIISKLFVLNDKKLSNDT